MAMLNSTADFPFILCLLLCLEAPLPLPQPTGPVPSQNPPPPPPPPTPPKNIRHIKTLSKAPARKPRKANRTQMKQNRKHSKSMQVSIFDVLIKMVLMNFEAIPQALANWCWRLYKITAWAISFIGLMIQPTK